MLRVCSIEPIMQQNVIIFGRCRVTFPAEFGEMISFAYKCLFIIYAKYSDGFFPDLNLAVRKDWSKGMIYARVVI